MSNDIWDEITWAAPSALDQHLSEAELGGPKFSSLQDLTDRGRDANGLDLSAAPGTRVSFITNLGSVLAVPDMPGEHEGGTIVMVRTGHGDTTHYNDEVFVKWDDGKLRAIHRHYLRRAKSNRKRASSYRITASGLGDISSFFTTANGGVTGDLIHKSTKDLWSFEQGDEGIVINRLFDDSGDPLKG